MTEKEDVRVMWNSSSYVMELRTVNEEDLYFGKVRLFVQRILEDSFI